MGIEPIMPPVRLAQEHRRQRLRPSAQRRHGEGQRGYQEGERVGTMRDADNSGTIMQTSYWHALEQAEQFDPHYILSIMDTGDTYAIALGPSLVEHIRVECNDIAYCAEPVGSCVGPSEEIIGQIIELALRWGGQKRLLVHCMGGVSRSGASVCVILAVRNPGLMPPYSRPASRPRTVASPMNLASGLPAQCRLDSARPSPRHHAGRGGVRSVQPRRRRCAPRRPRRSP